MMVGTQPCSFTAATRQRRLINLLPQKRRAERSDGNQLWLLALLAILLLEVAGLFVLQSFKEEERTKIAKEVQAVQAKIEAVKKTVADHENIKKQLEELRAREAAISQLQAGRTGPTAVMLELARLLTVGRGPMVDPDRLNELRSTNPGLVPNPTWDARRLWILEFAEIPSPMSAPAPAPAARPGGAVVMPERVRRVTLRGYARDGEDVSELAKRMQLSSYFENVVLLPAVREKQGQSGLDLVRWALEANLKY